MPKDDDSAAENFYQNSYSEGFTTECPSEDSLAVLIARNFAGSEKDFSTYIDVLRALGLQEGDSLLDFGASWGYGSWQFRQAGFRVFSYEVNKQRAEYARARLSCEIVPSIDQIPERVNCLFSAHVIEHLPNPNLIWDAADRVLADNGLIVCFCPNGDPVREKAAGPNAYDLIWGKIHPLIITPKFLACNSGRYGYESRIYSSPYNISDVRGGKLPAATIGEELCMVSRRTK